MHGFTLVYIYIDIGIHIFKLINADTEFEVAPCCPPMVDTLTVYIYIHYNLCFTKLLGFYVVLCFPEGL